MYVHGRDEDCSLKPVELCYLGYGSQSANTESYNTQNLTGQYGTTGHEKVVCIHPRRHRSLVMGCLIIVSLGGHVGWIVQFRSNFDPGSLMLPWQQLHCCCSWCLCCRHSWCCRYRCLIVAPVSWFPSRFFQSIVLACENNSILEHLLCAPNCVQASFAKEGQGGPPGPAQCGYSRALQKVPYACSVFRGVLLSLFTFFVPQAWSRAVLKTKGHTFPSFLLSFRCD